MGEFVEQLSALIEQSFPDALVNDREHWAQELADAKEYGTFLEAYERSDRDSVKDIRSLCNVAQKLEQAAKALSEIGWFGSKSIAPIADKIADHNDPGHMPFDVQTLNTSSYVSEYLRDLGKQFLEASHKINPDAYSNQTAFDPGLESKPLGFKHKATTAHSVSISAKEAYQALSGKRATVPSEGGVAYGEFLMFVTKVFEATQISASPEAWARTVIRRAKK